SVVRWVQPTLPGGQSRVKANVTGVTESDLGGRAQRRQRVGPPTTPREPSHSVQLAPYSHPYVEESFTCIRGVGTHVKDSSTGRLDNRHYVKSGGEAEGEGETRAGRGRASHQPIPLATVMIRSNRAHRTKPWPVWT